MYKVRNVLLATAFLTMAGIAGCRKVPDVIKETPAEQVDTTKLFESMANANKAFIKMDSTMNTGKQEVINALLKETPTDTTSTSVQTLD